MLIRRWMTRNPDVVGPGETLAQARQKMDKGDFRRLPVVERGQLVGIITDRDLRQHVGQFRAHAGRGRNGQASHYGDA